MRTAASARWRRRCRGGARHHRHDDQARRLYPFSGPASAYASIASGAKARFEDENAKGGIDGRKIEFVTLDDGYEPQRAVDQRPPARRAGQGVRAVQHARARRTTWRSGTTPTSRRSRTSSSRPARRTGAPTSNHPYTTGWQPDYVSEAKRLRGVPQEGEAQREGRGALPERRLRQGPARRLREGASRARTSQVVAQRELRGDRPDDHLADAQARRRPAPTRS